MTERPERQPSQPDLSYTAFLVRCWRDGDQWRIVLEEVATRERRGFSSVEAFLAALQVIFNQ